MLINSVTIPGGTINPDHLRRDKDLLNFVAKINEDGRLIGAIFYAGWVLLSAKILQNRKTTNYFAKKGDMINAGCIFKDSSIVLDKYLITSRIPSNLPNFMRTILKFLED
ncbi:MAG: DJ-1/PfpI family protein [Candidatus Thorarchaeota archaeon]